MDSAFGCSLWHGEGQWHCWCNAEKQDNDYRTRIALQVVAWEAVALVVVLALLTLMPHAVLLSAVGRLFRSSFTNGLVPVLAFAVGAMSLTYGFMVGKLKTVYDAFLLMSGGVAAVAPLVVVYVFVAGTLSFHPVRFRDIKNEQDGFLMAFALHSAVGQTTCNVSVFDSLLVSFFFNSLSQKVRAIACFFSSSLSFSCGRRLLFA